MYKDFLKDSWEDFNRSIEGKDLYIWGAGAKGKEIAHFAEVFSSRWNICGFIDRDLNKKKCGKWDVYRPDRLNNLDNDKYVVLISPDNPGKIAPELEKLGVKYYFSYFWLNTKMRDIRRQNIEADIVESLEQILSDAKSKEILRSLVEKRRLGFLDYTDIKESGAEYFCSEFFSPKKDEVFIDAGAFDGDTIEEFIDWTKNDYEKIYTFEPDAKMVKRIRKKAHRWHDVELIEKGLWKNTTSLPFVVDNEVYSSYIPVDTPPPPERR